MSRSVATRPATERRTLAAVAAGDVPADLVIQGGRLVDVYSGRTRPAGVAISNGRIAATGDVQRCIGAGTATYDAEGSFLVPGLIDTHLHVVGCQLTMAELSRSLVEKGTAAVSACFYEAGQIGGRPAVDWMLEEAAKFEVRVLFSPFIACQRGLGPFGNLGRIGDDEFLELIDHPDCVEIREWNVHLETLGDPVADELVRRARATGKVIAGHLQGMAGAELQASVAVGASSDHEAVTADEALERIALGVKVQIREGSAARDFDRVIEAITLHGADPRFFMFCTDGQEAHHTASRGHIDGLVRRSIDAGLAPIDAIRMASLNAAEYLRVDPDLGSITPGRTAHINVVDDLMQFEIRDVIVGAERVVQDGSARERTVRSEPPARFTDTIRIHRPLDADDLRIASPSPRPNVRMIEVRSGSLVTGETVVELDGRGGALHADAGADRAKMAVIDRHEASGRIGLGFVRGFGLERGAIATTNSPALMNLMTLGVDDEDMARAANHVCEIGGGVAAVLDGEVLADVALPVFGVLSDRPAEDVVAELDQFERAVTGTLGSSFDGLVSLAGFVMMAVSIPGLKLCDRGLVRVRRDGLEPVSILAGGGE